MIVNDNLVTLDRLDGYETTRSFGFISGAASRPRNRLRATFRSLGMLVGLAGTEFLTDAEQLRNEALQALRKRAEALGANAVIAIEFVVSEGSDGRCEVVAIGKAVSVSQAAGQP